MKKHLSAARWARVAFLARQTKASGLQGSDEPGRVQPRRVQPRPRSVTSAGQLFNVLMTHPAAVHQGV